MTPFRRRRGRVETIFELAEGKMLANLTGQVIELLHDRNAPQETDADPLAFQVGMTGPIQRPDDPVLRRLLPDGYRDDEEDSAEFRRYTEQSITIAKVEDARAVLESLDDAGLNNDPKDGKLEVQLGPDKVSAWLRAVNDMRISLAVRLGIDSAEAAEQLESSGESGGAEGLTSEQENEQIMRDVYLWLGYVQDSLVSCLD